MSDVGGGIKIFDTKIQNTIGGTFKETADEEVTTIFIVWKRVNSRGRSRSWRGGSARWVNGRLAVNCSRREGKTGKGTNLITELIVAEDNKAALFTLQCMGKGKGSTAPITIGGEIGGGKAIPEVKSIAKLSSRKFGASMKVGTERQPGTRSLSTLEKALHGRGLGSKKCLQLAVVHKVLMGPSFRPTSSNSTSMVVVVE